MARPSLRRLLLGSEAFQIPANGVVIDHVTGLRSNPLVGAAVPLPIEPDGRGMG